ncbi:D-alanyl-D-alanine carboxypeptidase family protein [Synechococcus sp. Nb3U1]|nr:D-alanyl-D-alanine carboxypeptidase family protein [Synechococcus sp. Nb3U1]
MENNWLYHRHCWPKRGCRLLAATLAMLCVTLLAWGIPSLAAPRLVVVPDGPGVLERVHSLAPDAFRRQIGSTSVIQVGAFRQQDSIDLMLGSLALLGLQGQVWSPEAPGVGSGGGVPRGGIPFHWPYPVAPEVSLEPVSGPGGRVERLHREAAQAFRQMQQQAQASSISLVPISGFRDLSVQTALFRRQIQRQGSEQAAMRLSAPPGYSEHHTGYALDIGDGRHPQTHVQYSFAQTPAYAWLAQYAPQFGFELSFPQGNAQGVNYEPWHWRYVGSPQAASLFAQARLASRL